jgi:hypothetical protein
MSVAPHNVLASANLIYDSQNDEAGCRAVISRAYYAAYNAANDFHLSLPSAGIPAQQRGIHERLVEQLVNPTLPTTDERNIASRRIGWMLRDCHRDRVIADYYLDETVGATTADKVLRASRKILDLAQST